MPVAALVLYEWWLAGHGKPALYDLHRQQIIEWLTTAQKEEIRRVRVVAPIFNLYFGLFLLPTAWLLKRPSGSRGRVVVGLLFILSLLYLPLRGLVLPRLGGGLYNNAVYPLVMFRRDLWPQAPHALWFALTVAALLTAALAAYQVACTLATAWRDAPRTRSITVLCVLGTLGYLVPYALLPFTFDRYLMVPAILVMILLARAGVFVARPGVLAPTMTIILLLAAFDIAATRDYFAFSRARWAALDAMITEGIPPQEIRGGLEVTGSLGATLRRRCRTHWQLVDARRV